MTLQSGTPPYDYAVGDPLRVVNPYTNNYVVGGSGLFLEQGQFIITAEMRKFASESHRLEEFNKYINPAISPIGPYEPKADGSNLGSGDPANMFIINHILDTRDALDVLFNFYRLESENTVNECRVDWLKQIAPELPLPTGYRRFDPGATSQPFFVTTQVDVLGGSGVLFDLDFAEVMFNPYPMFAYNTFLDVHGLGFVQIFNGPAWPSFQKTNGGLVSLNGREPSVVDGISAEYDVSHFAANEVRLDGHVFLPQTDFMVGHGLHNFIADGSFTYVSSASRNALNGRPFTASRVFATTQALSSGVYKLAARNRRDVVPFTTVASGLVSQWPPSGQAYPATNGHTFHVSLFVNDQSLRYSDPQFELGYQVFDDAFWIIDSLNTRPPSGLAILTPFTGHPVWVQFADLELSSGSGVFGGSVGSAGSFGSHIGLERVGSTTFRVQRTSADGSTSAFHTALIQRYNDDLDYLSEIETPEVDVTGPVNYTDMIFSSSMGQWLLHRGAFIERFSSDFSTFIESQGSFYIGALELTGGNLANSNCIGELEGAIRAGAELEDGNGGPSSFHTQGSGIWDLDFTFPAASGIVYKDCRIIDLARVVKQASSFFRARIYDLITVPITATHTVPGSYALISVGTTVDGESHRLFLVRIQSRDDATAPDFCVGFWDVLAAYDLGPVPDGPVTSVNNFPNILWKPVP